MPRKKKAVNSDKNSSTLPQPKNPPKKKRGRPKKKPPKKKVILNDRMMQYEKDNEQYIHPYRPFIVRMDGKNFGSMTRGMEKPYDKNFVHSIVSTMNDMINYCTATTGYAHDDEIILIFPAACTREEYDSGDYKEHIYDGRAIKLLTTLAGYCSVRFNYYLSHALLDKYGRTGYSPYETKTLEKVASLICHFDAKLILFPEDNNMEVVNYMRWRSLKNAMRGSIVGYAVKELGAGSIAKQKGEFVYELLTDSGFDWENVVPLYLRYGVFAKRVLKTLSGELKETGRTLNALRPVIVNKSFRIEKDPRFIDLLLGKHWTNLRGVTFKEYNLEDMDHLVMFQ